MKALKIVGISLLVLILATVGSAYLLPREVTVERSVTIAAAPEAVFPYINSLKKFNEWSPWFGRDPNAKYSFSGPESGEGASMSWEGNDDVGKGT